MKINIGQVKSFDSLIEKTKIALEGQDQDKFSLRADKKGNFSLVDKDNFFQRLLLRSSQTKNAVNRVGKLIDDGVRDRQLSNLTRFKAIHLNGEDLLRKAGVTDFKTHALEGSITVPVGKFTMTMLLGDKLNNEVKDLFRQTENKKKWNDYSGEKSTETSRIQYLKSALTSEELGTPNSAYRQLCCPGKHQKIKTSEFHDEGRDNRLIEFTPCQVGTGDGDQHWLQLQVGDLTNAPKIIYTEPKSNGSPKEMNDLRLHSFDKFRISVHPDDMEKAFQIIWGRIGHDMATSDKPSIYAFKVHDCEKHGGEGKTSLNHQFTLYLPLPDSVENIYGKQTEDSKTKVLTGESVNKSLCSEQQANAFCELMSNIEADLKEAGIRPNVNRDSGFNTDYNIQGSEFFSMRNELLNDRDKSRTESENQVLSQRQLPMMLQERLGID